MLLSQRQKEKLVHQIITKAQSLLAQEGVCEQDSETGLEITTLRMTAFVLVDHQRQRLPNGEIQTNGLDIWHVHDHRAKKVLSVNYLPFRIKQFELSGKPNWTHAFLAMDL